MKICVRLTNLKLQRAPLYADDGVFGPDEPLEEEEGPTEAESNAEEAPKQSGNPPVAAPVSRNIGVAKGRNLSEK